jgi:hypothetical protein
MVRRLTSRVVDMVFLLAVHVESTSQDGKPLSFFAMIDSVMTRPQQVALWQVPARRL